MAYISFNQGYLAPYAGPGHWNDSDRLEVGNGGMTNTEYKTSLSLWCRLVAGNDLSEMSPQKLVILSNKEAIAIEKDPLGKAEEPVVKNCDE